VPSGDCNHGFLSPRFRPIGGWLCSPVQFREAGASFPSLLEVGLLILPPPAGVGHLKSVVICVGLLAAIRALVRHMFQY
jgi:hypothetical protein